VDTVGLLIMCVVPKPNIGKCQPLLPVAPTAIRSLVSTYQGKRRPSCTLPVLGTFYMGILLSLSLTSLFTFHRITIQLSFPTHSTSLA
jgi:hypothetical protein